MKKIFAILVVIIICNSMNLLAKELPGTFESNTTLTKAESPYLVNNNVTVLPKVELIIEEGVEIIFNGFYKILIRGSLKVLGSEDEPVKFTHNPKVPLWENIYFHNTTAPCLIQNAIINNGTIYSQNSILSFESITMNFTYQDTAYAIPLMYLDHTQARMTNSIIKSNGVRQGFIIYYADNSSCENSYFENVPDAIEFSKSKDGIIANNTILNSTDDCIDLNGCNNVRIINNKIFNATDKGISLGNENLGKCENIIVKGNIITGCESGIAVKDSSKVLVINNTLYNNKISLNCYEKRTTQGGGFVTLINNIMISDSVCLSADEKSQITAVYSLTNDTLLPGVGNIKADPMFVSTDNFDFHLQSDSPCIDAGDPNSELDPDSTIADIGAYYFNQSPKIVINEINYNSSVLFDSGDWLELYNNEEYDVDISNWKITNTYDSIAYIFPDNTLITANSFIVICSDSIKFKSIFDDLMNIYCNFDFGINDSGQAIKLFSDKELLIDFVEFNSYPPWDTLANGKGFSLELINPNLDNTLAENWRSSLSLGTPGMLNENYKTDTIEQPQLAKNIHLDVIPNPIINVAEISITVKEESVATIMIYDNLGNQVELIYYGFLENGNQLILLNMTSYSSGIYFLKLVTEKYIYYHKIIHL